MRVLLLHFPFTQQNTNKTISLLALLLILSCCATAQQPEFLWARNMGGNNSEYLSAMAVDAHGNVYSTGFFQLMADFDPGPGTSNFVAGGQIDIFISKLDTSGNFVWAKQLGGTSSDRGDAIAVDADGNVYTTGYFTGTADFDPGAGTYNLTAASSDIFISKLDASGNFVWAKQLGGTEADLGSSIAVDAGGNVYITGYFTGTADFDPGAGTYNLASAGSADHFICKLDAGGNFIWAKQFAGKSTLNESYITLDILGSIYVTGTFFGTVDFDPDTGVYEVTSVSNASDIYICKLDEGGNFVWAKQIGGGGHDYVRSIAVDVSGNVYTTGRFSGTADFDSGAGTYNLTADGSYDIFICKLNISGNFVWAKRIGSPQGSLPSSVEEEGKSIVMDGLGNIYITGLFAQTADFDPGIGAYNLTSAGGFDVFISQLDTSGNFIWAGRIGGTGDDYGKAIALDAFGNLYTAGNFQRTVDFDPDSGTYNLKTAGNSSSSLDVFIQKMHLNECVTGSLKITTARDTVCTGTPTILSVSGGSGSVRWQSSVTGNRFTDIPGATSKEYVSQDTVSSYFRAYSSNTGCPDTSAAFKLIITPSPVADFIMSSAGSNITFTDRSKGAIVYHWDFGDGTTDTEQNPVHTYTTADIFRVCLTVYNGSNCSFTMCKDVQVGITGIGDNVQSNEWKIYPSPFSSDLYIELSSNHQIKQVELIDVTGKIVKSEQITKDTGILRIDGKALPQGIYFLRAMLPHSVYVQKVVKTD